MNTKVLLLLPVLFFQLSFLNAQTGNCVVVSPTGDNFYLALDNKFQNEKANTNIKVTGIPEGDYWVTVFFDDVNKKAFKTNIRVLENKETTYNIEDAKGLWKLTEISSTSKSQTNAVSLGQSILTFNEKGVAVKGYKTALEIPQSSMQSQTEMTRVQGDISDIESKRTGTFRGTSETIENNENTLTKSDIESRRTGTFSSSSTTPSENNTATNPTPQPEPETGTTIESKYIKIGNADGTFSIVEEQTITEKEIVERDGQKQLKTKKSKIHNPTDFTCMPMAKDTFIALKESVEKSAPEGRLSIAEKGIKNQCLTPGQIKTLGDLILSEVDRNTFAIAAKPTCAEAAKFPYQFSEPIVVKEEIKEPVKEEVVKEEEVVVVKEETPKTKEQLKAELKALKDKEKADKAAAKAAAKKKKDEEKAAAKAAKVKK